MRLSARNHTVALSLLLAAGCAEMRGIPTHGGGKRFDEEQRAVAGAIRRAVADMDLKSLQGKSVLINVESISHSGGGSVTYPGLQSISGGYSEGRGGNDIEYPWDRMIAGSYPPYFDNENRSLNRNWNLNATINPNVNFNSSAFGTDSDLSYLRAAVTMKAQHTGLSVVSGNPDVVLYVLVDILGMNRSRRDSLVCWKDTLEASCELTYYAIDAKTNRLVFRARCASAASDYEESSFIGFTAYRKDRSIRSTPPSPFAVDGEEINASAALPTGAGVPTTTAGAAVTSSGAPNAQMAPSPASAASAEKAQREYLDTQLRNADLQIQIGALEQAQRLIDAVRAVDPNYPGLVEKESRLQRRKSER